MDSTRDGLQHIIEEFISMCWDKSLTNVKSRFLGLMNYISNSIDFQLVSTSQTSETYHLSFRNRGNFMVELNLTFGDNFACIFKNDTETIALTEGINDVIGLNLYAPGLSMWDSSNSTEESIIFRLDSVRQYISLDMQMVWDVSAKVLGEL